MNITTKFELEDRVTDEQGLTGRIIEIETVSNIREGLGLGIIYRIEDEKGGRVAMRRESLLKPAPKKLTSEEAWAFVGIMIAKSVSDTTYACRFRDLADSNIRHRAYQILGGNGIDVGRKGTPRHEEVKAQLNSLIEAAILI